jgi:hypothetical protein
VLVESVPQSRALVNVLLEASFTKIVVVRSA